MIGRDLRHALAAGQRVYGIGVEGYRQPIWPKNVAQFGLDFVFVENEHMPMNRETVSWITQLYAAHGVAPLLRIPDTSPTNAYMGMDLGAHGIIAPYVETIEQVKKLVGAVKYRPIKGAALDAILEEGRWPSDATRSYLQALNVDSVLVLMIESPAGVANLPGMLATGGVDAVLIGPHDFSISHGVPEQYAHPIFEKAAKQVVRTCREFHVSSGIYSITYDLDYAIRWAGWGCNVILHGSDARFLYAGLRNEMDPLKKLLEGSQVEPEADPIDLVR